MIYDNVEVNRLQEALKDKARIADEFAAKGDYQQAVYRLTDALIDVSALISLLKVRGGGPDGGHK